MSGIATVLVPTVCLRWGLDGRLQQLHVENTLDAQGAVQARHVWVTVPTETAPEVGATPDQALTPGRAAPTRGRVGRRPAK